MDGMKVRALYDFAGEPGSAELTINAGEVLQVTRRDVGEGWWEGTNSEGITGLFPAAYVEEVSASSVQHAFMPNFPQTPPVGAVSAVPVIADQNAVVAGSPDGGYGQSDSYSHQASESQDFWDDEWDDDSEGGSGPRGQTSNVAGVSQGYMPGAGGMGDDSAIGKGDGKATVRRNLNRFSNFVKSGGESYVLGTVKVPVTDVDRISLQETDGGILWCSIGEPYSCIVASPKKESKLKGLKSFIAYQLTPTFNNIQVSRRYKHFDWLHERLEEKFSLIPIPPLPDKQISGRYEEMFIEHRRVQLQAFVDYVCKHPVLSQSWVWQHFITCTDEKRWKAGKRRAEKDELVGANFFLSLKVPEKSLDAGRVEQRADHFHRYVHEMDLAVKNLMTTAVDQAKKHQGPYKREFQRIGQSFLTLSQAACVDEEAGEHTSKLGSALRTTGEAYMSIGKMFEDQPKADWEPLSDVFHIYRGILSSYPDNLSFHKGALQKRRDCEKLSTDSKMDSSSLTEVTRRTDVVSYALLAEINHHYNESSDDLNKAMRSFLIEQIAFYEKVVNKLKETLTAFDV